VRGFNANCSAWLSNWIPSCGIVQCEVATATRGRVQLVIYKCVIVCRVTVVHFRVLSRYFHRRHKQIPKQTSINTPSSDPNYITATEHRLNGWHFNIKTLRPVAIIQDIVIIRIQSGRTRCNYLLTFLYFHLMTNYNHTNAELFKFKVVKACKCKQNPLFS
jgi:hypothetical protein